MLYQLWFILFAFLFGFTSAGNANGAFNPDSLDRKLVTTDNVEEKIEILIKLAEFYVWKDPDKTRDYADQLLVLSKKSNNQKGIAYGNFFMARIFIDYDYDIAEKFLLESMVIAKNINDKYLQGKLFNSIGNLKNSLGLYDEEIAYYNQALEAFKTIENDSLIAALYNNFGVAYASKGNDSIAIIYYEKAAEINEKSKNRLWLSTNYMNIGNIYNASGEMEQAITYLNRSLQLALEYDFDRLLPWIYNNMGIYYFRINDLKQSKHYSLMAIEKSKLMSNRDMEIKAMLHLKEIYESEGDIKTAYQLLNQIKAKSDSLMQNNRLSEIDRLNMVYKFEREIKLSELKHKNQTLLYWTIITLLVFTVSIAFALFYLQRLKSKKDQLVKEKLEIEKELLKKEIDAKSRELITKTMHLSSMNEMINDILNRLSSPGVDFKEENQKNINEIVASLKMNKKTNILESFDKEFTEVHPSFFEKLSIDFPEVTQNEKRLCAFLKLNMNSKEISEISHLEIPSVEKARTRLRKKLNLTGSETNLSSFLQSY